MEVRTSLVLVLIAGLLASDQTAAHGRERHRSAATSEPAGEQSESPRNASSNDGVDKPGQTDRLADEEALKAESGAPADDANTIEVVELIEARGDGDEGGDGSAGLQVLARLHPALVHMPIAWLFLLAITDFMTFVMGRVALQRWGLYLLIATVASYVPAVLTGFLSAGHAATDPELAELVVSHRNLALIVVASSVFALAIRIGRGGAPSGVSRWLYLALVFGATALAGITGHLGGKMVFGPDYLPF